MATYGEEKLKYYQPSAARLLAPHRSIGNVDVSNELRWQPPCAEGFNGYRGSNFTTRAWETFAPYASAAVARDSLASKAMPAMAADAMSQACAASGKTKAFNVFHQQPPNMSAGRGIESTDVMSELMFGAPTRGGAAEDNPRNRKVDGYSFHPLLPPSTAVGWWLQDDPRAGVDTRFVNKRTSTQQTRTGLPGK